MKIELNLDFTTGQRTAHIVGQGEAVLPIDIHDLIETLSWVARWLEPREAKGPIIINQDKAA